MKKIIFSTVILLCIFSILAQAQFNSGQRVFNFLNHSSSARITALGGTQVALRDGEVTLAWANPAALTKESSGQLSLGYDNVFAGIGSGYAAYAKKVDKIGMIMHGAMQYMNYGSFDGRDEFGFSQGTFKGQDMALAIGAAKPLSERWNLGLNLKYILSNLENYNASGISTDVGATYSNPTKRFSFGITARNIGTQLGTYAGEKRGKLPLEIQLGIVKRLKHLPLQYSINYRNVEVWDIRYRVPPSFDISGNLEPEPSKLARGIDNLARHLTFGGELLLGKNETFRLRFGYAHLLKRELTVSPFRSLTGFSYGFGFKVKRFKIDLGRSTTHMAGGMTHFTFGMPIGK